MKKFIGKERHKIYSIVSQGKQKREAGNKSTEWENETFDYNLEKGKLPKFSRSVSSGQKPIYARIVFSNNIRQQIDQDETFGEGSKIQIGNIPQAIENKVEVLPQDQRSQRSVDLSEQDYENYIRQIEEQFKQEFFPSFIEDSIQLEALYYQLVKNNFIRTPITSSPPLIAYYIFCLLAGYKSPDPFQVCQSANQAFSDFNNILQILKDNPQSLPLKLLFLSLERNKNLELTSQMTYYHSEIQKLLSKCDYFNFRLAIDDLEKYVDLYLKNKEDIEIHLQKEIYKRTNLCIGFIRFLFLDSSTGQTIFIRIPLGQFHEENFMTYDPNVGSEFSTEPWFKKQQEGHSEKILLKWIVENQEYLVEQVYQEISKNHANLLFLLLQKVYFEVTSERRICIDCVGMFSLFPSRYISIEIVSKLNKKFEQEKPLRVLVVMPQFQLIVVSQYLCESQNKESGSDNQSSFSSLSQINRQRRLALPKNQDEKFFIYFEIGYVGMTTQLYIEYRYASKNKKSLITKPIDSVQLTNTIFISCEISGKTLSQKDLKKGIQLLKLQKLLPVSDLLKINIKKIMIQHEKIQQMQDLQSTMPTIEQIKIQSVYSLIWFMIQNFDKNLIPTEVDPFYLRLLMSQCLKINDYDIIGTTHCIFFVEKVQIYQSEYKYFLEEFIEKNQIENISQIFDFNFKLFIEDYIYLKKQIKPQFIPKKVLKQTFIDQYSVEYEDNLGILKVLATVINKNKNKGRIELKFNVKQFDYKEIIKQISSELKQVQQAGQIIEKIQYIFCSIQQLSEKYQTFLESNLSKVGHFKIEFLYTYLRPSKQVTNNEKTQSERFFCIYNFPQFQLRYQLQSQGTQISFYDMDVESQLTNSQILIFQEKEINEKGVIEQKQQ